MACHGVRCRWIPQNPKFISESPVDNYCCLFTLPVFPCLGIDRWAIRQLPAANTVAVQSPPLEPSGSKAMKPPRIVPSSPPQEIATTPSVTPGAPSNPGPSADLLFKDSLLFTEERQQRIKRLLGSFKAYFVKVGVYVPNGILPIGTGSTQATSPEGPTYREYISIPQDQLDDPKQITRLYSDYIVEKALTKGQTTSLYPLSTPEAAAQFEFEVRCSRLFLVGFLEWENPTKECLRSWTLAFWDIRNYFVPWSETNLSLIW